MKQIWNYILENWDLIAPLIYEIIVRLVPTKKNWSLIDNGWKVLNFLVKNKRKSSPEDLIANHDRAKNVVNVPIDKHILTIVILLLSLNSFAQINKSATGYYSTNVTDTTFIQNTRTSYQSLNGNTGVLYFDKSRNKWRVWTGSVYADLASGSGEATTASNGLTETGNNIALGGALTGNTAITGASTNNLQLGTSGSKLFNGEIYAAAAINLNGANSTNMISGTSAINVGSASGIAIQAASNNVNINTSTTGYLQTAATGLSTFTGKHTFTPTATLEGINVGAITGIPSAMTNGGIVYNSTGNDLVAHIAGGNTNIVNAGGDFAVNRIPYAIATDNQLASEAALTYDPSADLLSVANATISTNLRNSALTTTRVPFIGAAGLFTDDAELTYGSNTLQVGAASPGQILIIGGNFVTTVSPGEIQLDDIVASDDITLNNSSLQSSGQTNFTISNSSGALTLDGNTKIQLQSNSTTPILESPTDIFELNDAGGGAQLLRSGGTNSSLTVRAGITNSSGSGSTLNLEAANSSFNGGTGGNIVISSGDATDATAGNGGNITLTPGDKSAGTGAEGTVIVNKGMSTNGSGFKHARANTGSISAASTALVTVTWGSAFADTNYTVQASVLEATASSLSLSVVHIETISASQVAVRIINNAAGSLSGTLHLIAVHD